MSRAVRAVGIVLALVVLGLAIAASVAFSRRVALAEWLLLDQIAARGVSPAALRVTQVDARGIAIADLGARTARDARPRDRRDHRELVAGRPARATPRLAARLGRRATRHAARRAALARRARCAACGRRVAGRRSVASGERDRDRSGPHSRSTHRTASRPERSAVRCRAPRTARSTARSSSRSMVPGCARAARSRSRDRSTRRHSARCSNRSRDCRLRDASKCAGRSPASRASACFDATRGAARRELHQRPRCA